MNIAQSTKLESAGGRESKTGDWKPKTEPNGDLACKCKLFSALYGFQGPVCPQRTADNDAYRMGR